VGEWGGGGGGGGGGGQGTMDSNILTMLNPMQNIFCIIHQSPDISFSKQLMSSSINITFLLTVLP